MRSRRFGKLILAIVVSLLLAAAAGVAWLRLRPLSATVRSSLVWSPEPTVPAVPEVAVRVASFNAWLLPIGADDADGRRDRMGAALDALAPDVLCMQEVWTDGLLEPLVEALASRLPDVARSGGGLVILSRWPIRDAEFEEYPADTAPSITEWLARKGFLSTLIETPAGPLRVVDTHLAFDHGHHGDGDTEQLSILLEALSDKTDIPTVLCADLNLRSHQDGIPTQGFAALLNAGFDDAAGVDADGRAAARQGTRVGWPRAGRHARWDPDYLMFRSGDAGALSVTSFRQALNTEQAALSDHNLQLADLVLRSTQHRRDATSAPGPDRRESAE